MDDAIQVKSPWALDASEVASQLGVDLGHGLSSDEAKRRLAKFGENRLQEGKPRSRLKAFFGQFADLMIGLLAAAACVSAVVGEWQDAVLIAAIVLANAIIGYVQEERAETAIAALKKLSQPNARAVRDGRIIDLSAVEIVIGDVIELAAGSRVPADCRLVSVAELEADESPLTGESLPVAKQAEPVAADASLSDRASMAFAGTSVVAGHGRAIVTATGMSTELGRIAELLESTERAPTPLQERLAQLSRRLAAVVVVICVLVFVTGMLRNVSDGWATMLLTAVSLAVAAIPEGLPAVITVTLALGSQRMARRKAIVRQLAAVETLGSVDVIASDKTGTLTQNRMTVSEVVPAAESDDAERRLLIAAALCNDAQLAHDGQAVGTATEVAVLRAAIERGVDADEARSAWPREHEIPFSSARKRMTTVHRFEDGSYVVFMKGAAELIVARSSRVAGDDGQGNFTDEARQRLHAEIEELAQRGRRVLALATRALDASAALDDDEAIERDVELLGFIGIVDPVRPEAREAIAECRSAGVRVLMITGDHQATARAVAKDLSLADENADVMTGAELESATDEALAERVAQVRVFARVSPEHKLRIVRAFQARQSVVAMTGDGVNDAPALKQADIGVAMGITGTDVSKEAAKMVLADDNFATIVAAVREGRAVYDNIRKFVRYLLTTNTGEVLVLFVGILLGLPLPLLPIHLLWINLVTDGLPALALGFEPPEPDIMRRRPRRRSDSIFADGVGREIIFVGTIIAAVCLVFYTYLLQRGDALDPRANEQYARTAMFYTTAMVQLFHVLALRSTSQSFFELSLWSNYRLTGAVVIGTVLQLATVYVPWLQPIFHTVPLSANDLALATALSTVAFVVVELGKLKRRMLAKTQAR